MTEVIPLINSNIIKDSVNTSRINNIKKTEQSSVLYNYNDSNINTSTNEKQNKSILKKQEKRMLAHDSQNYSPGHGLWCITTDNKSGDTSEMKQFYHNAKVKLEKDNLSKIKQKAQYKNKNKDATEWLNEENGLEMMDKKIIEKLKLRITNLTKQLQESMLKQNELEYKTNRAEEQTEVYKEAADLKASENEELISNILQQQDTIKQLNEVITNSQNEIERYKEEVEKLHEIIRKENKKYDKLKEEFRIREEMYNEENHTLLTQLQKISTANDESADNRNETTGINEKSEKSNKASSSVKTLSQQNTKEPENRESSSNNILIRQHINPVSSSNMNSNKFTKNPLDSNEFKLTLAIVDLKERNSKLESLNQIQYLNLKRKKEEIYVLKKQIEKYMGYVDDTKEQLRWREKGLSQKKVENEVLKSKLKGLMMNSNANSLNNNIHNNVSISQNGKYNFMNSVNLKPINETSTYLNTNRFLNTNEV